MFLINGEFSAPGLTPLFNILRSVIRISGILLFSTIFSGYTMLNPFVPPIKRAPLFVFIILLSWNSLLCKPSSLVKFLNLPCLKSNRHIPLLVVTQRAPELSIASPFITLSGNPSFSKYLVNDLVFGLNRFSPFLVPTQIHESFTTRMS